MKPNHKWDSKLARQLAVVLAVKICFIVAIKQIWFSQPTAQGMRMPSANVAQHLLNE